SRECPVSNALAEPGGQFQIPHLQQAGCQPLQLALPAKVATRRLALYDAYHSVMTFCGIRYRIRLGASRFPPAKKLDLCFEECGKPHQTGSAKASWPW